MVWGAMRMAEIKRDGGGGGGEMEMAVLRRDFDSNKPFGSFF